MDRSGMGGAVLVDVSSLLFIPYGVRQRIRRLQMGRPISAITHDGFGFFLRNGPRSYNIGAL